EAKPAVPDLIALLEAEEKVLRAGAAVALAGIRSDAAAATNPLVAVLKKERDSSVRLYAAQALYAITGRIDLSVPTLVACLRDEEPGVRAAAAEVLGEIGPKARQAEKNVVPRIQDLLKDREDAVRRAAHDALRKFDQRPPRPRP